MNADKRSMDYSPRTRCRDERDAFEREYFSEPAKFDRMQSGIRTARRYSENRLGGSRTRACRTCVLSDARRSDGCNSRRRCSGG